MSAVTAIAEAVKDELNAGAFSLVFSAERHYQPVFELSDMKTLRVMVVPNSVAMTALDRNRVQTDVKIDVAIQKKFSTGDNAELDPLMALVEEISDYLRKRRLAAFPEASWVRTENTPVFAPEHFQELRQFTSLLTITYRVAR